MSGTINEVGFGQNLIRTILKLRSSFWVIFLGDNYG